MKHYYRRSILRISCTPEKTATTSPPPGLTDRTGFGRSALQHRQSCEPHRAQTSWAQHLYQSAEWLTLWGLNEAADAAVKERSQ
jgi:hypothetical protein